jgi:hypothetical protein
MINIQTLYSFKYVQLFGTFVLFAALAVLHTASALEQPLKVNPFAVNNGNIPTPKEYNGPLYKLNHNYPTSLGPVKDTTAPWTKVLNGKPLSKKNAHDYIEALKKYVSKDMRTFVTKPKQWNKQINPNWYGMVWAGDNVELSGWEGRDAIYGTYTGQILSAATYKESGLKVNIRNHAAIYYDKVAAYSLHQVWKKCNPQTLTCPPSINNNQAQFKEGAIVIKAAGATASPAEWPVMEGAANWKIYRRPFNLNGTIKDKPPVVTNIYIAIFDIIVKDSIAAPETGWVFTTLVYDKNAPGDDAWDRMVPFGAMWGNDPKVNSAQNPEQPLLETYVNPKAPAYSKVTLGYGGRLSGPFDIAVKYNVKVDGKLVKALPSSSCMSCHGTSSHQPGLARPVTFFYPVKMPLTKPWNMHTPGSAEWNEWFQNRPGTEAQSKSPGVVALDYSTFLTEVLMNYAASQSKLTQKKILGHADRKTLPSTASDQVKGSSMEEEFWETWRNWQKARRH